MLLALLYLYITLGDIVLGYILITDDLQSRYGEWWLVLLVSTFIILFWPLVIAGFLLLRWAISTGRIP